MLAALLCKRAKLHEDLRNIEKQVISSLSSRIQIVDICVYIDDDGCFFPVREFVELGFDHNVVICIWVYDMETSYLQDPNQCGNVLKGFEGFLSSSKSTTLLKRSKKFQPEDRLFSLSSVTSPAAEDQAIGRDGGGISTNGQGKPKRGRGGPRDAKRFRQSSDADYDCDDDPDLLM
ncbi:hypothetical protein Acr_13g0009690 [Actinidia rufa]|uniref:Uncharacterized protein n=1 Tax=Actinidia rufa TaxID=165716 RepID=A0A7J0FN53_9ERIC|nr:hypothetical protein Acr_13g0009690 [Actinidia rufa]